MRRRAIIKCDGFILKRINFVHLWTIDIKDESLDTLNSAGGARFFVDIDIHWRFSRSKESQSTFCRLAMSACSSEIESSRASDLRSSRAGS